MTTKVAHRELTDLMLRSTRCFNLEVPQDIRRPFAIGEVYGFAGYWFIATSEESPAREARRFKFCACPLEWLPDD